MKHVGVSLIVAMLLCACVQIAQADMVLDGRASIAVGSALHTGIEPAGLMKDESVVSLQAEVQKIEQTAAQSAPRFVRQTAKAVQQPAQTSRMIAIVPFDYKDNYGVGAFDSRRGKLACKMQGPYARCVYNKTQY